MTALSGAAALTGCMTATKDGPGSYHIMLNEHESVRMVMGANCQISFPYQMPAGEVTLDNSKAILTGFSFDIGQDSSTKNPCWVTSEGLGAFKSEGMMLNQGDTMFVYVPHEFMLEEGNPDRYVILTTVSCSATESFVATDRYLQILKDNCIIDARLTRFSTLGLEVPHEGDKPGDDFSWPYAGTPRSEHKYDIRQPR